MFSIFYLALAENQTISHKWETNFCSIDKKLGEKENDVRWLDLKLGSW